MRTVALALLVLVAAVPATAQEPGAGALRAAERIAGFGPRPAASAAEERAHRWVAARFRAAGLAVHFTRFAVPGRGGSRNVVARFDGPGRCLKILVAHTDSVPDGPGAIDNASGVGVLVALAPRLPAIARCDVWLVATGAEERPYTRAPDHLGATALVAEARRRGVAGRLRYALSLDMVGRGSRFWLRSPRAGARPRVEGEVLAASRRQGVTVRWVRDSGQGNSDHREFELAGLPGMVLQAWQGSDACYHTPCDRSGRLQARALGRVQRIAESLLRRG